MKPLRRRAVEKWLAHQHEKANVEHFLDAVGREHLPERINRRGLREDIQTALLGYDLAREFGDEALGKRKHKALNDQLRKATLLREALHGDCRFSSRMGGPERNPAAFRDLIKGLDSVIALAENDLIERVPPGRLLEVDSSAFVFLVGLLSGVFERRFGINAGYTKDQHSDTDADAKGPFIEFVRSVLGEAGVTAPSGGPYTANTIAAALTQFKHAKPRRKKPKPRA
jgi:hypothetical protein